MERVLVSTLGRAAVAQGARYQAAQYQFPDGWRVSSSLFGMSLFQWLSSQGGPPTRVLLLGTGTSMWDVLLETCPGGRVLSDDDLELYDVLSPALRAHVAATAEQLAALSSACSRLWACPVRCLDIGFCLSEQEQSGALQLLARHVPEGSRVSFDVTHGLRHLPLLGLLSVFHLQQACGVTVDGVYYGALEARKDDTAPVLRLDFVRDAVAWIKGVAAHQYGGSLAAIGDIPDVEPALAEALRNTAFYEDTNQVGAARDAARTARDLLQRSSGPVLDLYRPLLDQALSWVEGGSLGQRQLRLATRALAGRDYLRCSILLSEAAITSCVPRGGDPFDHTVRKGASAVANDTLGDEYRTLSHIRNALAHGSRPRQGQPQRALGSASALQEELGRLADWVKQRLVAGQVSR